MADVFDILKSHVNQLHTSLLKGKDNSILGETDKCEEQFSFIRFKRQDRTMMMRQ